MSRRLASGMLLVAAAALTTGAWAAEEQQNRPSEESKSDQGISKSDRQFMEKATQGNLAEALLGSMAVSKGTSKSVQDFGRRMIEDHMKAQKELTGLAKQKGVTLPSQASDEMRDEIKDLARHSGPAFDRAYMQHMVAEHQKDVAEYKDAAKNTKDSSLKAYAQRTLPTLEDHLRAAQEIARSITTEPQPAPEPRPQPE